MTDNDVLRLEKKLDGMDTKLDDCHLHLASLSQWKCDQERRAAEQAQFCSRQDVRLSAAVKDLHTETVTRTNQVGRLWTEIGKKLAAKAMLAAFLGSLVPALLVLLKIMSDGKGGQ